MGGYQGGDVHGTTVPPNGRISLGWASANFDDPVFTNPKEIQLDRKPNPHGSFGFGAHLCLGAPHAQLIVRTLIQSLVQKVDRLKVVKAIPNIEKTDGYTRRHGYESLQITLQ